MLQAKKSLGQHFLHDKNVLNRIVTAAGVSSGDIVLEIGPGQGALTRALLDTGATVIAVELDSRAIEPLSETFATEIKNKKLALFHADIADGLTPAMKKLLGKQYKLVANIPYYITGLIIRQFLEIDVQPQLMTLLIQREVAERIVARDKKYSLLSLSVGAYGNTKIDCRVAKGAFNPPPSVESAVVTISNISRANFKNKQNEANFFNAIKMAFGQKRKTIASTLASMPKVLENMEKLGFSGKSRPEDIPVAAWVSATH